MKRTLIAAVFSASTLLAAQSHISMQPHQYAVTAIRESMRRDDPEMSYITAGNDGFLIRWTEDNQGEHYQISDMGIKLIACSPDGNYIAAYETDGGSVNKITVWEWKTLRRKFMKKFSDSITSLAFSAKGSYLMAGTATVDGAVFIRTSNWTTVDKIRQNTGIVSYIQTSDTEKTCVMYSPAGALSYFDMQTGALKQKFKVVQGLEQTVTFCDNRFLAGVKDGKIYIINAYKGEAVASVPASSPIILSSEHEKNLYYLEYDGRSGYEFRTIEAVDGRTVANPRTIRTIRGPRGTAAITSGKMIRSWLLLGGGDGSLYRTETDQSSVTASLEKITENMYARILDMAPADNDFYFLTGGSVYKSSYDTGVVDRIADTDGQTQIISRPDGLILWTKASRAPVVSMDTETKTKSVLFRPAANIQTLRPASYGGGDFLIEIEANSTVSLFDMKDGTMRQIYSGTGIQDAILADNGKIYIAKSAASNPLTPMVSVDIQTMETVPLQMKGNVAYGLSTDGTTVYGINVQSDDKLRNTYVYSLNTKTNQVTNLLKFSDEDPDAFTYLYRQQLYTNIGKNKVYVYNLGTKKRFSYDRTAAMPVKVSQSGNRTAILNRDGSISWASSSGSKLQANWYLTNDSQWYEFN